MESGDFRVLGLSCSPRNGGNTDLMCDSALEGAHTAGASVEKVRVAALDIHPCRECNACYKTGQCVQQDDMQGLYPKLLTYEGIVLASPIFSMNLAAQAKILIDRMQCLWARKFVLEQHTVEEDIRGSRRGLWLGAAGLDRPTIFDHALPTVRYFFAMLEIKPWEKVLYHNVDDKGAIEKVPGALDACVAAGAWLVTGEKNGGGVG
jgi:hypothetical protein